MNSKEKILNVALDLFSKNWLEKSSTTKICKEAWLSSAGIFVHFPNKQNLIEELYLREKKLSLENNSLENYDENNPENAIKQMSKKIILYYSNNINSFNFIDIVQNNPNVSEPIKKAMMKELESQFKIIEKWIKSWKLKKIEPKLIADIWWNLLAVFIKDMNNKKLKKPLDEWLDIIWDSLKK